MFGSIWSGIKTIGEVLFYVFLGWCLGFAVIVAMTIYDGTSPSGGMRALIGFASMILVMVYGIRHMRERRRARQRQMQQRQQNWATPRP